VHGAAAAGEGGEERGSQEGTREKIKAERAVVLNLSPSCPSSILISPSPCSVNKTNAQVVDQLPPSFSGPAVFLELIEAPLHGPAVCLATLQRLVQVATNAPPAVQGEGREGGGCK
jgi:hypothetical protein